MSVCLFDSLCLHTSPFLTFSFIDLLLTYSPEGSSSWIIQVELCSGFAPARQQTTPLWIRRRLADEVDLISYLEENKITCARYLLMMGLPTRNVLLDRCLPDETVSLSPVAALIKDVRWRGFVDWKHLSGILPPLFDRVLTRREWLPISCGMLAASSMQRAILFGGAGSSSSDVSRNKYSSESNVFNAHAQRRGPVFLKEDH